MKVLVTGANGFLASHLIPQLLETGYTVIGLDDNSKYGSGQPLALPGYEHIEGSASDATIMKQLAEDVDIIVANAAAVGGVQYLSDNDGWIGTTNSISSARTLEAATNAYLRNGRLRRYVAISSSMVFDQADHWPTEEGLETTIAPPRLTYGMEKRAMESYVRAAGASSGLPYTIIRPFNCVGVGETRALAATKKRSGNVNLVMGHVLPDLIHKILLGQRPLHILGTGEQRRHFTAADDIAKGIIAAMNTPLGAFEDFNLATSESHSIRDVAEMIWYRMRPNEQLRLVSEPALVGDVEQREPSTEKAKRLLGFSANTPLDEVLDELIPWVTNAFNRGAL